MNYANELSTTGIVRPYWYQLVSGQRLMIPCKQDLASLGPCTLPMNKESQADSLCFLLGLLSFQLAPAL